jgi:hypothetical protein
MLIWAPFAMSLVSFAISMYTFFVATGQPEVMVVMPRQVRVAQGGQAGAYVYLQPGLIHTGENDRVEVILNLKLRIQPVQGVPPAEFAWDEQGNWTYTPNTQELTWTFVADAAPLLVSPKSAQLPTLLFIGPQDWAFQPGSYRLTLIAERAVNRRPLERSITITLTPEQIDSLNAAAGQRFITVAAEE